MIPDTGTDPTGTSSVRLRSALRTAGERRREIPPKSTPIKPASARRRHPTARSAGCAADITGDTGVGVLATNPVSPFLHDSGDPLNQHAGHHGYGPRRRTSGPAVGDVGESTAAQADPSTTQLNSDTYSTLPNGESTGDVALGHHSHRRSHTHGRGHGRTRSAHGGPTRRLRRQTSHKGLLSRLALQFPLIKASFQQVHQVFQRFHEERVRRILAEKEARGNGEESVTLTSSRLESQSGMGTIGRQGSEGKMQATTNNGVTTINVQPAATSAGATTPMPITAQPASSASNSTTTPAANSTDPANTSNADTSVPNPDVAPIASPTRPSNAVFTRAGTSSSGSRQKRLIARYMADEISLDKLSEVLHAISGGRRHFTDEEVRALFKTADLDGNKTISFREFLIAVALGYFLKEQPEDEEKDKEHDDAKQQADKTDEEETRSLEEEMAAGSSVAVDATEKISEEKPEGHAADSRKPSSDATTDAVSSPAVVASSSLPSPSPTLPASSSSVASASVPVPAPLLPASDFASIARGFRVIQKAFRDIDTDGSNSVDVSELKKALFATSQTKDQSLLELRFKELDFDGDGDIYFPEFLYGFVSWVGFMEDEEE